MHLTEVMYHVYCCTLPIKTPLSELCTKRVELRTEYKPRRRTLLTQYSTTCDLVVSSTATRSSYNLEYCKKLEVDILDG